MSDYEDKIQLAQISLKSREMDKAYETIALIMEGNMSFAEPHNLLGIYYELAGDDNRARKHYRAAYALDPTYKPACHNLERLVSWNWGITPRNFDFGELPVTEEVPQKGDE